MKYNDRFFTINKWNKKKLFLTGGDTSGQNTEVLTTNNPLSKLTDRSNTSGNGLVSFTQAQGTNYGLQNTQNNTTYNGFTDYIGHGLNAAAGQPKENVTYQDSKYIDPSWMQSINKISQYGNGVLQGVNQFNNSNNSNSSDESDAFSKQDITSALSSVASNSMLSSGASTATNSIPSVVIEPLTYELLNGGTSAATSAAANGSTALADMLASNTSALSSSANAAMNASSTAATNAFADSATQGMMEGAGLTSGTASTGMSPATLGALNVAAGIGGSVAKHYISDGLQTNTGDTIANVGNVAGGVITAVGGPYAWVGPIVTAAGNVIGGVVNAGWGHKTYGTGNAKNYLNQTSGFSLKNVSNDALGQIASNLPISSRVTYKDGWFTNKGKNQANSWNNRLRERENYLMDTISNAANNNQVNQMQNLLANYSAYGGPIDTITGNDMGAIEYGLMSDYLTTKNKQALIKDKNTTSNIFANTFDDGGIMIKSSHQGRLTELKKRTGKTEEELYNDGNSAHKKMVVFARNARKWNKHSMGGELFPKNDTLFALGGTLQSNGTNWGKLTEVNAGGLHETNPNEGVQMGVDNEGIPNLVEEGEVVYNDFVYSRRLKCPENIRKALGVKGKKDLSFADVAKKLSEENKERPNDPISEAGLNVMMEKLADAQETLKQELQAEKARAEFESLSPEEQQAIMQQRAAQQQAMQEQMAQQQGQQQTQQQVPQQQSSPEEIAMAQQAQAQGISPEELAAQQQMQQQMMRQQSNINAFGGKLYPHGGAMDNFYKAMGFVTKGDYDRWAQKYGIADDAFTNGFDVNVLNGNAKFMGDLKKQNPMLWDALSRGYDFGTYTPSKTDGLTFDFKHGGWGSEDYDAWNGSTDPAWKEAVENGLVYSGMTSDQIADVLRNTNAYKRGSDWLRASDDNRLQYLQAIYNSSDAPEAAKKYAGKFVDANGWLKDAARDYTTIFEDPNGVGVRNTHPGTFWKTPIEVLRNNIVKNLAVDPNGNVEEIITDVPTSWKLSNTYSYTNPTENITYNYYSRPTTTATTTSSNGVNGIDNTNGTNNGTDNTNTQGPKHRWEGWRYAGLLAPAAGLGLWTAGVGKPDNASLNAAVNTANYTPIMAGVRHIGDYLTYKPLDRDYYINKLNAQTGATRRSILNSGSTPQRAAALLAADYNAQGKIGDLARQAEEYNFEQRAKVGEFNRGTNQFNAQADNAALSQYADAYNRQKQFAAQMQMEAAQQQQANAAAWSNNLYANLTNLGNSLSAIGKENASMNMISKMGANGIFGTMDANDNALGSSILKEVIEKKSKEKKSYGGNIRRKKRGGLTY